MTYKSTTSIIALILAAVITAVFILLPKTSNIIVGYIFGLVGIAALWLSTLFVTKKNANYPFDSVFALVAFKYLILQIVCSAIVIVLELLHVFTLNYKIFIVGHIVLLAIALIRILLLGVGKKHIDELDEKIKKQTFEWGLLVADVYKILEKIDRLTPEIRSEIETTCDEIRFSDPMSHQSLKVYDHEIKESVITLDKAVESWNDDKISKLCTTIKRQIKDRNNQLKLLKQ